MRQRFEAEFGRMAFGANDLVIGLALAHRNVGTRQVAHPEHQLFELPLDFGEFALARRDAIAERAHLGAPPLALLGRCFAQFARLAGALRAQVVEFMLQAPPAGVGLQYLVDLGGIDAALG